MNLTQQLSEYVRACYTGLWIESHEHTEAIREIAALCSDRDWALAVWSISCGLQVGGGIVEETGADPLAPLKAAPAMSDKTGILVLVNYHSFLGSAEVKQTLADAIDQGKQSQTIIVVLSGVVQIPAELQHAITVLHHDLPDREQIAEIARGVCVDSKGKPVPGECPEGDDFERLLDAAAGLTRQQAEDVFALSLQRHGRLSPEPIWEQKSETLRGSALSLYRGPAEQLGGLSALTDFCSRSLQSTTGRAKGVMLLSPPGCGKSAFAKSLGHQVGRPTLILDVGALKGSLVGQTEQALRRALALIDAMSPCVVLIDEVEKALAGSQSDHDSGVSAGVLGTLLTWLNDRESDSYVVCTSNGIDRLPPEFARAERFDGVFFIDLPGRESRGLIWDIHRGQFGITDTGLPSDDEWTGAEIASCCRLAQLLGVSLVDAAQYVVPIARTAQESIGRLRSWASGRCLSADKPGIYQGPGKTSNRRKVSRPADPSSN